MEQYLWYLLYLQYEEIFRYGDNVPGDEETFKIIIEHLERSKDGRIRRQSM